MRRELTDIEKKIFKTALENNLVKTKNLDQVIYNCIKENPTQKTVEESVIDANVEVVKRIAGDKNVELDKVFELLKARTFEGFKRVTDGEYD